MKRSLVFGFLTALFALLLAACGAPTPEPVTITMNMSEYAFDPNTIEVKVGQQVTLEMVNQGLLAHEIMFGRDVMMMNNRPSGYQMDMFAAAGIEPEVVMHQEEAMHEEEEGHSGFMVVLPASGDEATLTFTVTKDMLGEWEIGCFEQEGVHYDAGMKGKFIVSE